MLSGKDNKMNIVKKGIDGYFEESPDFIVLPLKEGIEKLAFNLPVFFIEDAQMI